MTPLDYARRGWRVFPCDRKTPLIRGWGEKASTDSRMIAGWWRDWPRALVGVPTGRATGFVVLDIDVKDPRANGFDSLAELEHAILPETWMARTPSGGLHVYFNPGERVFRTSASKLAPGLDIRGEGGLIIVPSAGSGYRWDPHYHPKAVALASAPDWLTPPAAERRAPAVRPERSPGLSAYGDAAVNSAGERILAAPCGAQHSTLLPEAFSLGTLAGAGLPAEFARKTLKWAGMQMISHDPRRPWRQADIDRTVDDGFAAGLRQPRGKRA